MRARPDFDPICIKRGQANVSVTLNREIDITPTRFRPDLQIMRDPSYVHGFGAPRSQFRRPGDDVDPISTRLDQYLSVSGDGQL